MITNNTDKLLSKKSIRYFLRLFSGHFQELLAEVDHKTVITELYSRTGISANYLGAIVLSNLIALLGLLTNSVSVVIGAMVISPLMGPIFSLGLGFTLGDLPLARRATRIIVVSILLTVFVAAFFTLLSPLKGMTHEILARTRPNIYDLLIAIFAGTAGALALCTRKNYLFTTTGVAVATAVIPPLSVVGYGIGTWQTGVAMGGFLLFFTNLVAIVISSDIVFYLLKFRGSMVEETGRTLRKRFQILGSVLIIISLPLVYTLVVDLQKVKLTAKIERSLKVYFNSSEHIRLTNYSYQRDNGKFVVQAVINTVKYIDSKTEKKIENALTTELGGPVNLQLEQIIVKAGDVEPQFGMSPTLPPVATRVTPPPDTLATLRDKIMGRVNDGCRELESFIAPYKITQCSVEISNVETPMTVQITIARDYPFSEQEQKWLQIVFEKNLREKVTLELTTIPFLPPVSFDANNQPDEASKKMLMALEQLTAEKQSLRVVIDIPKASSVVLNRQTASLKQFLVKDLTIPEASIKLMKTGHKEIRVRVIKD